eukprot:gene21647-22572_t
MQAPLGRSIGAWRRSADARSPPGRGGGGLVERQTRGRVVSEGAAAVLRDTGGRHLIEVTLKYDGGLADEHALDFYDASRALVGFERSLALVTHLVLTGEVITQAPSLAGAKIFIRVPEEGSWKVVATIGIGIFTIGAVGKDSPVGQIVTSAYDYVLMSSMGFHVDYNKTLQQQYHEHMTEKGITEGKLNSVIEKTEASIADIHRPIVGSHSAHKAYILGKAGSRLPSVQLGPDMNAITFAHLMEDFYSDVEEKQSGKVSSYNVNTYKGRFFVIGEGRTVPFELADTAKSPGQIARITGSLRFNANDKKEKRALITVTTDRVLSRNGRLKKLRIIDVQDFDDLWDL